MTTDNLTSKKDPTWKRFEKLVARIQKDLAQGATVKWNDSLPGFISKTARQLDVTIRAKVGQFEIFIVMSCKHYNRPVDAPHVEEFVQTMRDVRANRGAMVALKGFTQAAKNIAEHHGIDLFTLIDASKKDWSSYLTIPIFYRERKIQSYQLHLEWLGDTPDGYVAGVAASVEQLPATMFYSRTGEPKGTPLELIGHLWNMGRIPTDPGDHRIAVDAGGLVTQTSDGTKFIAKVFADITVVEKLMFGYIPLDWIEGFKNEVTGGVTASQVKFNFPRPEILERTLKPIKGLEDVAVAPLKLDGAEIGPIFAEIAAVYGTPEKTTGFSQGRVRIKFNAGTKTAR